MKILQKNKNDFPDLISTPFLVRGMAQCLCVSCKSIISCYFWGLVALRYYSFWKCPCPCPNIFFKNRQNFFVKISMSKLPFLILNWAVDLFSVPEWIIALMQWINHNSLCMDSMNFNSYTKNFGFLFQMPSASRPWMHHV